MFNEKVEVMKKLINLMLLAMVSVVACGAETLEWKYDSSSDTYYVTGIVYCDNPADRNYETMGIYVPSAYLTKNQDGTWSINASATCNGYTAATAPIVMPVNTAGYKAQSPPTGFTKNATSYTGKGFIYLFAGCRGKDASAPSAVTDLKSAIKYYRYLSAQGAVPGDSEQIYAFGHSGGGAQTAILGACGNSALYDDYLSALGAKTGYRDDIAGAMCWCPITNLDLGSEGYEWNMGLTRSGLSATDQDISKALAAAFADYINALGLKHPTTGEKLTLAATSDGYYQSGTYYEYVMEVINEAVNRYNRYNNASISAYSTTDASALSAFAKDNKSATKGLGAFDNYTKSRTSAGNQLFDPDGEFAHFDKRLAEIVGIYAPQYKSDFDADLTMVDQFGKDLDTRIAMYTPMYYLLSNNTYYPGGGAGSSTVAPHWRIRTGIKQGDTSLCTEINLALALQAYGITDVDFETIWGQGHAQAEDEGDATDNFIEWVEQRVAASTTGIESIGQSDNLTIGQTDDSYYTLDGRRVINPAKGLYIHHGKKVVLK